MHKKYIKPNWILPGNIDFSIMNIKEASKYSIHNMAELNKSSSVGCYYCKRIFHASDIEETIDEGKTALCPKCGIDSVL